MRFAAKLRAALAHAASHADAVEALAQGAYAIGCDRVWGMSSMCMSGDLVVHEGCQGGMSSMCMAWGMWLSMRGVSRPWGIMLYM